MAEWWRRVIIWIARTRAQIRRPDPQLTEIAGLLRELVQAQTPHPAVTPRAPTVPPRTRPYTAEDVFHNTAAKLAEKSASDSTRKTSPWRFADPPPSSPM